MPRLYYIILTFNAGALTCMSLVMIYYYVRRLARTGELLYRRGGAVMMVAAQLSFVWRTSYRFFFQPENQSYGSYLWYVLTFGVAWTANFLIAVSMRRIAEEEQKDN